MLHSLLFVIKQKINEIITEVLTNTKGSNPAYSPDGQYIVYTNLLDGNKLYKKNSNDLSDGTAITTVGGFFPTYSPDGQYIVYRNNSTFRLYKKNANDVSDGTEIGPRQAAYPKYSPDGQYIIYFDSLNLLWKKNANDTNQGNLLISNTDLGTYATYSPDGQYIIYTKYSDGLIYKKNANDTSIGTAITTVQSTGPKTYYNNGNYILYEYNNDLYKKNANDASNGNILINKAINPDIYNNQYIVYKNNESVLQPDSGKIFRTNNV